MRSYDDAAADYDGWFTRPVDRWEDARLARLLHPLVDGRRALDLGCGTGWLLDHCAPSGYLGVDCSKPMLAELLRKHPAAEVAHVEVMTDPAWAVPLRGDWDVITATWSLEFLGELGILLSVLRLLAGRGGVLALHGTLPRGHRRAHFTARDWDHERLTPRLARQASRGAGMPRPRSSGTSALPDALQFLGPAAFRAALAAPASAHYSALFTWRLP